MLTQEKTYGVVQGLALFGDHADPKRIYYIQTRPSIAMVNGKQEMVLVKYQSSDVLEQGGVGLLSFTTDLSVTEKQLEACVEHLEDLGISEAVLLQVPWLSGKAYFAAALQEGDGFVEKLYGEVKSDMIGENRALFSALLNEEGANFVEAMLDTDDVTPLGVRYELEYAILRPAFDIKIRADYKRIYNELSMGFEIGVAYEGVGVRAGVEKSTQKLIESGAIQVEVLHFTDDADLQARVDGAVKWFQEQILEDMFKSSIQPPAHQNLLDKAIEAATSLGAATLQDALGNAGMVSQLANMLGISPETLGFLGNMAGDQSQGGAGASGAESTFAVKLQFQYKDIKQEELKTMTLDWSEARAERRTAAPQGLLSSFSNKIKIVEANDKGDYWEKLKVNIRSLGNFDNLGIIRMILTLAYPDETDPDSMESFTFEANDESVKSFGAWTNGNPPNYRTRTEVHFKDDSPWQGEPIYSGEWHDSSSLELSVHPLTEIPRMEVEILPGTIDFTESPQVQIDFRVGDDAVDTIFLNNDIQSAVFKYRPELTALDNNDSDDQPNQEAMELDSRITWFMEDGRRIVSEWSVVDSNAIMVQRPWKSQRTLRLFPVLPDDFIEAIVSVSLTEGSSMITKDVLFAAGERRTKKVTLPSMSDEPPPMELSVVVVRGDGSMFIGDPVEVSSPVFLVRDRQGTFRQVKVRLLAGPQLANHGVMAIVVDMLDENNQALDTVVFTESNRESGMFLVPVDEDGSAMRYRIIRYSLTGKAFDSGIEESADTELLVTATLPG